MILIDTHVLVWTLHGDPRVGTAAIALIDRERARSGGGVSPITAWETAMLVAKGRLAIERPVAAWFEMVFARPGFVPLDLTAGIAVDAGCLPGSIHGDPADRIIIATARAHGCAVLTADRAILGYAAAGHVRAIDAGH